MDFKIKLFKRDIMIVYKRNLKKEDIKQLDDDEELIYYYDDNIAYTVIHIDNFYLLRKKNISNSELIEEKKINTPEEIITLVK